MDQEKTYLILMDLKNKGFKKKDLNIVYNAILKVYDLQKAKLLKKILFLSHDFNKHDENISYCSVCSDLDYKIYRILK